MASSTSDSTATRQDEGQGKRRGVPVVFHLTGFGKFNGVPDNPTTHLMRHLEGIRGQRQGVGDGYEVRSVTVLEVSAEEGGRQVGELHAQKPRNGEGASEGREEVMGPEVFVHCGVDKGGCSFKLERSAYNLADFRVPDERGYTPADTPVDSENPDTSHTLRTDLPVTDLVEGLGALGWGGRVGLSDDPGRYVCNYVYYSSLNKCRELVEKAVDHSGAGAQQEWPRRHSLFIHVPPFSVIPEEEQVAFISDCLDLTAKAVRPTPPPPQPQPQPQPQPLPPSSVGLGPGQGSGPGQGQGQGQVQVQGQGLEGVVVSDVRTPSAPPAGADFVGRSEMSAVGGSMDTPMEGDGGGGGSKEALPPAAVSPGVGPGARVKAGTAAGGAEVERTRLVLRGMGFDLRDIEAALATTNSPDLTVNVQLLRETAAIPRPCHPDGYDPMPDPEVASGAGNGAGAGLTGGDAEGRPGQGRGAWGLSELVERERRRSGSSSTVMEKKGGGVDMNPGPEVVASMPTLSHPEEHKLVLIVRRDLFMGVGKVAAESCHAALAAVRAARSCGRAGAVSVWQDGGEKTDVVGVPCSQDLDAVLERAQMEGVTAVVARNKGRTEVPGGTCTVGAIGPAPSHLINQICGKLPLL